MKSDGAEFSIADMLFHHTADGHELEFGSYVVHLPRWELHLGGMTLDVSPTKYVVLLALAAVITLLLFWVAGRSVQRARAAGKAPSGIGNFMEMVTLYVRDEIAIANIGKHDGPRWAPLIVALFFLILFCNLLGLVPFGGSPTGNLGMTAVLAFIVLMAVEIGGMIKLGPAGYLRTIFPKIPGMDGAAGVAMSIGMAPIEVLSKLVKPFALAVRLFGNITAGHFVMLALFGIVFLFSGLHWAASGGIALITAAVVVAIMGLELIVAILQAYVFAMLSAVFIGMMQHEH